MRIFSIFKKDLLILLRDRAEMAVLFLMPLAFILPISFALGKGDGYGINRNNRMILLPVANYDGGLRAQLLLTSIGESLGIEQAFSLRTLQTLGLDEDETCFDYYTALQTGEPVNPEPSPTCAELIGRGLLQRSARPALLVIPEGFTAAVEAGQPAEVTLIYDPAGDSIRMQQVEGVVKGATIKLSIQNRLSSGLGQMVELSAFAPGNVKSAVEEEAATPISLTAPPAVRIEKIPPQNAAARATPDTYQQTIPGYTVMYVFFIITSLAVSVRQEQLNGTFRRLLVAPVGRSEILAGKLLATMAVGVAQVLILFVIGALVFGLSLGSDPLAFLLLTLALVAAASAIGLAAATTRMRGAGLGAPLVIAALLGGCLFPMDLMPPFLRTVSSIVPHSWALTGYQNLIVRGQGIEQVFPQIAALLCFALVFFLIAVLRFDFETQEGVK